MMIINSCKRAKLKFIFKILIILFILIIIKILFHNEKGRMTVYEYYAPKDKRILSGLEETPSGFKLNKKDFRILSGAMHYFRVHPDYWRDRMKRMRSAGINTLETYVVWNLHEPRRDYFDFGDQNEDFSIFLDLRKYLLIAQEEDLLVILRPGPYICSEWDFGGLPSWLLQDANMKVRSSYPNFLNRARKYLSKVLQLVSDLQFQRGGPIIAYQIENEYGSFVSDSTVDIPYLEALKEIFEKNGVMELKFTADSPTVTSGRAGIPGILQTANFDANPEDNMNELLRYQPNSPIFVAEYWIGWFDHWFDLYHHTKRKEAMENTLKIILKDFNASINFYMFHGGTNFGFMAGANQNEWSEFPRFEPDVTSYDYDAPISENGDYNEKYYKIKELISKYVDVKYENPPAPPENSRKGYSTLKILSFLGWDGIINQIPEENTMISAVPLSMENLLISEGSGQSYGYIVYRIYNAYIGNGTKLRFGKVKDLAIVLVDGKRVTPMLKDAKDYYNGFGTWMQETNELIFKYPTSTKKQRTIDIIVENMGRVNYGKPNDFDGRKGLFNQTIYIDDVPVSSIEILGMDMKAKWINDLKNFEEGFDSKKSVEGPGFYRAELYISGKIPQDTFILMKGWNKGVIFVNNFNIGRYFNAAGPQNTLYIPAHLLFPEENEILIFELWKASDRVRFQRTPNLGPVRHPPYEETMLKDIFRLH